MEPSLNVPTALSCTVPFSLMVAVGPTVTEVSTGSTKNPLHPTMTAKSRRVANAAKSWIVFLPLDIFKFA